jgi:hypothetical protein
VPLSLLKTWNTTLAVVLPLLSSSMPMDELNREQVPPR